MALVRVVSTCVELEVCGYVAYGPTLRCRLYAQTTIIYCISKSIDIDAAGQAPGALDTGEVDAPPPQTPNSDPCQNKQYAISEMHL